MAGLVRVMPSETSGGDGATNRWKKPEFWGLALAGVAILVLAWAARDLLLPSSHPEPSLSVEMTAQDGRAAGIAGEATQTQRIDRRIEARPYLGITYIPVSPRVASRYGLEVDWGILITAAAAGGPADRAGVQAGDILLFLEEQAISPEVSFLDLLWHRRPGATVKLVVWREGRHFTTEAVLGSQ